ncbi:hypothetical protein vseg_008859 [Gypsophila vaccaria]
MAISSKIQQITLILGVIIAMLVSFSEARDHIVGGKVDAWKVTSDDSQSLNKWAQKNRFLIGDNLVWKYDSKKDSVLQVTREAYLTCNTTSPIAEYKTGDTKVGLDKPGPHYFISGVKPNCDQGEKVLVVVITPRTNVPSPSSGGAPAVSPALSPFPSSAVEAPAVAPASGNGAVGGVKGGFVVGFGVVLGLFLLM